MQLFGESEHIYCLYESRELAIRHAEEMVKLQDQDSRRPCTCTQKDGILKWSDGGFTAIIVKELDG